MHTTLSSHRLDLCPLFDRSSDVLMAHSCPSIALSPHTNVSHSILDHTYLDLHLLLQSSQTTHCQSVYNLELFKQVLQYFYPAFHQLSMTSFSAI